MFHQMIQILYQNYKNDIYLYLLHLTHDKELSEDLTSETFLNAITALPRYKGKANVKTWLFSIARFKWYEHIRKNKLQITNQDLLELYLIAEMNIEQDVINREMILRIHQLLELESDRNKGVFLMRVEGFSFFEIALHYHISESSARVIDFRIRNKLKDTLKKEGYE